MTKCQHCKKLTHSEDMKVYFSPEDYDKIVELRTLQAWKSPWEYTTPLDPDFHRLEIGRLKCGDINLCFIAMEKQKEETV